MWGGRDCLWLPLAHIPDTSLSLSHSTTQVPRGQSFSIRSAARRRSPLPWHPPALGLFLSLHCQAITSEETRILTTFLRESQAELPLYLSSRTQWKSSPSERQKTCCLVSFNLLFYASWSSLRFWAVTELIFQNGGTNSSHFTCSSSIWSSSLINRWSLTLPSLNLSKVGMCFVDRVQWHWIISQPKS